MQNGKGSRRRPEDTKKFSANWDSTFGKAPFVKIYGARIQYITTDDIHECHDPLCDCGGLSRCIDPNCTETR